uniref:Calmodulin-binding transcription activator 5 n=1 Tax=Tanacetum cinerariifolium TaxID=118510 RepID=A0A699J5K6_TANCI|nr:calmodulin-binding transcription activator 5 [Tanacetum cinerariifolium]
MRKGLEIGLSVGGKNQIRLLNLVVTVKPATKQIVENIANEENISEESFFQASRKQVEERVERSFVRVQAMFRSKRAQEEYRKMKLEHNQASVCIMTLYFNHLKARELVHLLWSVVKVVAKELEAKQVSPLDFEN